MVSYYGYSGAQWDTAENLVPHYGLQQRIWFRTMGYSEETVSTLWAIAQEMIPHYGPQRGIWLATLSYCTGDDSALWITARDLVPHYGLRHGMIFEFDNSKRLCYKLGTQV